MALDSDHIGPGSRLHGDLDANVLVIGQDWGDVLYYRKNRGLDDLSNPTTRMLEQLLRGIGIGVSLAEYGTGPHRVFLTNAILCLKAGGLQGGVEREWFDHCGTHFLRKQIEIIQPVVAVALGQRAHEAALRSFGLVPGAFRAAVEDTEGVVLPNGTRLLAVYHCGKRILNTHRPSARQHRDWLRVAAALRAAHGQN